MSRPVRVFDEQTKTVRDLSGDTPVLEPPPDMGSQSRRAWVVDGRLFYLPEGERFETVERSLGGQRYTLNGVRDGASVLARVEQATQQPVNDEERLVVGVYHLVVVGVEGTWSHDFDF